MTDDPRAQQLNALDNEIKTLERYSRFTAKQLMVLTSPLAASRVSKRSQSGSQLSYVEAHDIKNMLIRIFGFGGFSSDVIESSIIPGEWYENPKTNKQNVRVLAKATVRITIHPPARPTEIEFSPVTYTESAVSSQVGADEGDTADFAIKTAESDAFKRAAIFLGTQFGLSLYANGSTEDQVQVVFEPTQARLLALGRRREHLLAAAGAGAGGAIPSGSAPNTAAPQSGVSGAAAALQGALHNTDGAS